MRPWYIGLMAGFLWMGIVAAVPFLLGLRGDSHMGNWLGIIVAIVCYSNFVLSLGVGFLADQLRIGECERVSKLSAGLTALMTFSLLSLNLYQNFNVWLGNEPVWIVSFWGVQYLIPLMVIARVRKRRSQMV